MKFNELALSNAILEALDKEGYDTPTPIQQQAIKPVLNGRDVMAAAQTGTGKTAAFTLPLLQRLSDGPQVKSNHIRALILTPTRELAAQVLESVRTYGQNLPLRSAVVYGGVKINPQMMKLRKGVDILVATPGRLLDLYNQNAVRFNQVEVLVLDEADRMLDMGFIHDLRKIMSLLPKKRQNLLFSATFSQEIRALAKTIVNNPVEISVSPNNSTVDLVEQVIYPVDKKQKSALLASLILEEQWYQALVFTRTKHGANKLIKLLDAKDIKAMAIHGNKSQGARTRALSEFKKGELQILVATDIAARGLDIDQLPQVVNFDLPSVPEDYVHRIGRTGRAGKTGQAISLVCADEFKELFQIERLIQQIIPRKLIDGFEPVHDVPASSLDAKPPRSRKPKKPKKDGPKKPRAQRSAENKSDSKGKSGKNAKRDLKKKSAKSDPKKRYRPKAKDRNKKR